MYIYCIYTYWTHIYIMGYIYMYILYSLNLLLTRQYMTSISPQPPPHPLSTMKGVFLTLGLPQAQQGFQRSLGIPSQNGESLPTYGPMGFPKMGDPGILKWSWLTWLIWGVALHLRKPPYQKPNTLFNNPIQLIVNTSRALHLGDHMGEI